MKISAQEEYGLRCLLQLARQPEGGSVSLRQIAEGEGISVAYAGKLLWLLNHAGLVRSVRGKNGGYALVKPASEVMLSDVIHVFDEQQIEGHCQQFSGDLEECVHTGDCTIRPVVVGLNQLVHDALSRISLAQLMGGDVVNLTRITRPQSRSSETIATG